MMSLQLCLVSAAVLFACGSTSGNPTRQYLDHEEVAAILGQLAEPYKISKMKKMNFMEQASDKMLQYVAEIPAKLEEVHNAMDEAINGGVQKINAGRSMLAQVEGNIDTILHILDTLKMCSSKMWTIVEGRHEAEHATPTGSFHLESTDDDDHDNEEWGDLFHVSQSELEQLLMPTTGVEKIIESTLKQYNNHYADLPTVLEVVQQLGQQIEEDTLKYLPTRLERMKAATEHLGYVFHHVDAIASTVNRLESLASQTDHTQITRVGKKVERISHAFDSVACLQP